MASENVNNNHNDGAAAQAGADEKISLGTFAFSVTPAAITRITDQIGRILEAQVILRGENSLGYGTVTFNTEGEPVEGGAEFTGPAKLGPAARSGKSKSRSSRNKNRNARRSADDVDADGVAADSAAGTQVDKAAAAAAKEAVAGARAPRAKKSKSAADGTKAPKARKERGEPSKTLVFIRNIPYTFSEEQLASVLSSNNLTYKSLTIPIWRFGRNKGQGRGFAFASVETEDEQSKVIEALDGKEINESGLVPASEQSAAAEAPAATNEDGTPAAGPRKLKLHVRKGYEGQDVEEAEKAEKGASAEEAKNAAAATADGPVA